MPDQRLAGQDVEILLVQGKQALDSITNVKNTEITFRFERKEEDFLGEFTTQYDEFFKGATGRTEVQMDNPAVFELISSVVDRAQRRTPSLTINMKVTLAFPSGIRRRFIIQNLYFGDFPVNFPGRTEYATVSLDFGASTISII